MSVPSDFEQTMLEMINRFRLDPAGEFDRILSDPASGRAHDPDTTSALDFFGVELDVLRQELAALDPAQPLVWNAALAEAAAGHTARMQAADEQSHQLEGEPVLGERASAAGYDYRRVAENIYAYAQSPRHGQDGFVVDWGYGSNGMQDPRGHRDSLIAPAFSEIGIAALRDDDTGTQVGPWIVTQNLGTRDSAGPFLLGAAWRDRDGDRMYSMDEGRGRLKVIVEGRGRDKAADTGGYAIETGEGTFDLTLKGRAVKGWIEAEIEIGRENAKIDVMNRKHVLTSVDLDLSEGARSVTALGVEDIDLSGKNGRDRLVGNAGDNTLSGGRRKDKLLGQDGDDTLIGNRGRDKLKGGPGDDTLRGGWGEDIVKGGRGNDVLRGGPHDDRLKGGGGGDVLHGGRGEDYLKGGPGADTLRGGAGSDMLRGGRGDDVLRAGPGDDNLRGGADADLFVFGAGEGENRILDWEPADTISLAGLDLSAPDVAATTEGGDAVFAFLETRVIVEDAAGKVELDDLLL
ncbi:MAG: CAP domain-containing protein [Pseudomonadota bacterium]